MWNMGIGNVSFSTARSRGMFAGVRVPWFLHLTSLLITLIFLSSAVQGNSPFSARCGINHSVNFLADCPSDTSSLTDNQSELSLKCYGMGNWTAPRRYETHSSKVLLLLGSLGRSYCAAGMHIQLLRRSRRLLTLDTVCLEHASVYIL